MAEEVQVEQVADPASTVVESDTTKVETAGDTGALENVEETDEQKNERVQAEAAEKAERKRSGVEKRMAELTADKYAERKRADEMAEQNRRILALLEGKTEQPKVTGEPQRGDFADYELYLEARTEYRAEQKVKTILAEHSKQQAEAQTKVTAEQSEQAVQRDYLKRQNEAAKTIPDFREVMEEADVSVPADVLKLIMRMPDGPTIAYHMAKQPELAQQFWDSDPSMHGIILGQLSTTLKAPTKISTAPGPGKTVSSKPGSSNEPPSDPALYFAWAEKHMPKR